MAVDGVATSSGAWRGTMRGPVGTRVRVRVERDGWAAARTFALVRERIRVAAVELKELARGVAHVRVRKFQQGVAAEVQSALESWHSAASAVGVVLDLRGNPGGLFDEAVALVDLFVSDGVIVSVAGRRGRGVDEERARALHTWDRLPLVVLIDEESASAAEIVAGALQDHGRATLVGMTSFGKGTVQSFIDLSDGSGIKLTTARYFTPSGRSIQGLGIAPDVKVASGAADAKAVDAFGLPARTEAILQQDRQLFCALRVLRGLPGHSADSRSGSLDTLTLRK